MSFQIPMREPKQELLHEYFVRYADEIERYIAYKLGEAEAADLKQQVYLHALQHADVASLKQPKAYLFRVAANLVVDTYRRRQVRARHDGGALPDEAEIRCGRPGPEAQVQGQLQLERLRAALAELPTLCRHAFLLNRIDGLTHGEIAERLGISKKSVERHILKALHHCLEHLSD